MFQLHLGVFLVGFTAILGALISLHSFWLVWYRLVLTIVSMGALLLLRQKQLAFPWLVWKKLLGIGALMALHWVFFYASIKAANVSVALVCFASVGFFTALLEPILLKKKGQSAEALLGLLGMAGILLIYQFDTRYRLGIGLGLVSALLAAWFSILNKKQIDLVPTEQMVWMELSGGWILLSVLALGHGLVSGEGIPLPQKMDWVWLLVLSWVCTVWAQQLLLAALKKVSAFTLNLTLNLEPVYGILLAFWILKENQVLGWSFYAGLALLVTSVAIQMQRVKKQTQALKIQQ